MKLAKLLRIPFFTEHLQWLLLWLLLQNNLIFSAIRISLDYDYNFHRNTAILSSFLYKNIHFYQKYSHLVQKFCSLSRQSPNFITLSSIHFCMISIFFRGSGVSHSNTVHLIIILSQIEYPSTNRRTQLCLKNVPETIPWLSKFI